MTEKTNWLMRVMGRVGGGKVQAKKLKKNIKIEIK
jgi:hypothetical protein